jgi:hypothetical protein
MPHGGNFNPEWGYLAPRPGFIRTLRAILLAGAIGTVGGMAVAVALVARPAADVSVAERTMAQPSVSATSPKSASANEMVVHNDAQHVTPPPQLAASPDVDHRDLKDLAAVESRSAATVQPHTSVAALAEAPAVSDANGDMPGGVRPSEPPKAGRVQQPASVAALAETPAWRDDASEMSSEAAPLPSPKRVNTKALVARVRTPHNDPPPRNDPRSRERQKGGPLDFLPMIGRTILGANPFWND